MFTYFLSPSSLSFSFPHTHTLESHTSVSMCSVGLRGLLYEQARYSYKTDTPTNYSLKLQRLNVLPHSVPVRACVCVFMWFVCLNVFAECVCVCVFVCVCTRLLPWTCVFMCACPYAHIYVCMCVCIGVFVNMHTCVCVHVCECACTCA